MDEPVLPVLKPESLNPALNPILVTNGVTLDKLKRYFDRKAEKETRPIIAIDYETNMTKTFHNRRARTLQIGDRDEQYVIDFLNFAQTTEALVSGQGRFQAPKWARDIVNVIKPVFESDHFLKVGQNLSFEYEQSLFNFGVRLWGMYSVDIAEKIILAGKHSFKDLGYFSLSSLCARHLKVQIDKSKQKSFDLETPLDEDQVIYGCLDLRLPLAIRAKQLPLLEEYGLDRVTQVENDAIGFFTDIHLNGIKTDPTKWSGLVSEWNEKYREAIQRLDTHFLPVVGPKNIPKHNIDELLLEWKQNTVDSDEELAIKADIKATKDKAEKDKLRVTLASLVTERKKRAADARKRYSTLSSQINAAKKVFNDCEGEAAINYGSNAQLKKALWQMKGINEKTLSDTNDDTLKKFKGKPVIDALRDYRTYAKMLETYGQAWYTPYTDTPSSEQGWVSPESGRIHSRINQLEAETGRTSSTKPNIQNLPADPRIRSSFVADGEDKVIVTCDMSGAELRIIAEESGSKKWIDAFNNGWDLHSCGTETLYPEEWPAATEPGCAYYENDHQKCKCPKHKVMRDSNKATNFLLAYGGGPGALAEAIGKSEDEAKDLMRKHERANPEVWAYLEKSGKEAVVKMESRSLCGRRRLFNKPEWEKATEYAKERKLDRMKKDGFSTKVDKEGKTVKLTVDDMHPSDNEIRAALRSMHGSIERQGKNLKIQSLNATIAKVAFGGGQDSSGKPYLWHTLPKYNAKAINFVHDEICVECPREHAEQVLEEIRDCIKRAGAEFLKSVVMESEGRISEFWQK